MSFLAVATAELSADLASSANTGVARAKRPSAIVVVMCFIVFLLNILCFVNYPSVGVFIKIFDDFSNSDSRNANFFKKVNFTTRRPTGD
jgi:hypothetical protein